MRRRDEPPEIAAFRARWRRWVDIVDRFARRRPNCSGKDMGDYHVLYKSLIQGCRDLAEAGDEGDATFYRRLEDMVSPWLTPGVLARSDREILQDLVIRCREAGRRLGIRSWDLVVPAWMPRVVVVSVVGVAVLLTLVVVSGGWLQALYRARGWTDDIWFAMRRTSEVERLGLVTVILVIVSIYGVSRTARS